MSEDLHAALLLYAFNHNLSNYLILDLQFRFNFSLTLALAFKHMTKSEIWAPSPLLLPRRDKVFYNILQQF